MQSVLTGGGGRPRGTEDDGYLVYKLGPGRPIKKAKSENEACGNTSGKWSAGRAGGRPTGTTKMNGYGIGMSGDVYGSTRCKVLFKDVELIDEWDTGT